MWGKTLRIYITYPTLAIYVSYNYIDALYSTCIYSKLSSGLSPP